MKHLLFSLLLLFATLPARGTQPLGVALSDSASWSIILLPDLQKYSAFYENQPIAELMIRWIAVNRERLHTRLVLTTGDLVDQNNWNAPDTIHCNQTSQQQWAFVSKLFAQIDSLLPVIHCTGNHDIGCIGSENRESRFPEFFPPQRNPFTQKMVLRLFPDYRGEENTMNACYLFTPPFGSSWIICVLEFNPRPSVVDEIKSYLSNTVYAQLPILFLTHSYLDSGGKRIEKEPYKMGEVTYGAELWQKLIAPLPQSTGVICGHVVDELSHRGHVGFSIEKNRTGRSVFQMLFNAQGEGGGWNGNGGDGWLRILEFTPHGKVRVITYSPYFGASPTTAEQALRKEPYDAFEFSWTN